MMKNALLPVFFLLFSFAGIGMVHAQINTDTVQVVEDQIKPVRLNKPRIFPGFGLALVRNNMAPSFHINIGFRHRNRYEANLNTASYFLFERGADSRYHIYRNTFVNAEFQLNFNAFSGKSEGNWNGGGIGYLVESRGGFFTGTTMQLYYIRKLGPVSVMPAVIFDDSFKDVWPMITIRL